MNQGMAFEKQQDILISDDKWTVVLNYDLTTVGQEAEELLDLLAIVTKLTNQQRTLETAAGQQLYANFKVEVQRIKNNINRYVSEINELLRLLPQRKNKRGLLNVGGTALKFLFGTLDDNDLENINRKLQILAENVDSVSHDSIGQLSLMKDMNSKITTNARSLREIMTKLVSFTRNLQEIIVTQRSDFSLQYHILMRYMEVSSTIRQAEEVSTAAKIKIIEFRQALELTSRGKLSSILMPPHELEVVLNAIEKMLPTRLSMYLPVHPDSLYAYYETSVVTAVASKGSVKLLLDIPLSSSDRLFELYKVITVPIYNSVLRQWMEWDDIQPYFATSKDRQYHVTFTESEMNACRPGPIIICSGFKPINHHTLFSCVSKIFAGRPPGEECPRSLRRTRESLVWVRTGNDWIFSVPQAELINVRCPTTGGNYNITRRQVTQAGVLKEVAHCDIFGDKFKIFSVFHERTTYGKTLLPLEIPKINNTLSEAENFTLSRDIKLTFETLHDIQEEVADDSVPIKLSMLIKQIEQRDSHRLYWRSVKHGVFGSTIGVIVLIIFICLCRYRDAIRRYCQVRRTRRRPLGTAEYHVGEAADWGADGQTVATTAVPLMEGEGGIRILIPPNMLTMEAKSSPLAQPPLDKGARLTKEPVISQTSP